jgi:hypothetical protein
MAKMSWKRRKAFAMLAHKRHWEREFSPSATLATEIEMEHLSGYYLTIESSDPATPHYIITE